jgi:hypothetical protein
VGGSRRSGWAVLFAAVVVTGLVAAPAVGQGLGWVGRPSGPVAGHDGMAMDVAGQNAMDHDAQMARIDRIAEANGMTPGDGTGPCKGWFSFRTATGVHCSRGPMLRSMFTEHQLAAAPTETGAGTSVAATSAADPKVTCIGTGTDGKRIQLVYARRSNKADGYATAAPQIKGWASGIEETFVLSAQKTGGVRKPRFVTDSSCVATVLNISVATTVTTFSQLVTALQGAGLTASNRKYVVAWDDGDATGAFCGLGETMPDSTVGSGNQNETQPIGAMFAALERSCWTRFVASHELMHTFGAVQANSPHATAYGHCTDDSDIMCYVDGPGTVVTQVCPTSQEDLYDCNNDDYFSTNPPSGNYLKTHWNPASSGWLDATGSVGPPTAPQNPTIEVTGGGTVHVDWSAPAYDGGSPVLGYVVTMSPGGRSVSVPAPTTDAVVSGLADGVAVTATIEAVNKVGGGASDVAGPVSPSPLVQTIATSPDDTAYYDIARGPSDSVYASTEDSIVRVGHDGTQTVVVHGSGTPTGENTVPLATTAAPGALAVASNGDIYYQDRTLGSIRRLSGGHVNTVAGNGGFGNSGDGASALSAEIAPTALAINPVDGAVFFVSDNYDVVRRFAVGGNISKVAGTASASGFSGDGGPATAAVFKSPQGLAIDSAGTVYVADTFNNRIRKFAVGGNIATIAGNGTNTLSLAPSVPALTTGVPFSSSIQWSAEKGLLIDTFGLERVLSGANLVLIAGVYGSGIDADGTPAATIDYAANDTVVRSIWSGTWMHVLTRGTNPTTSASHDRVRSAGPWQSAAAAPVAPSAPVKAPVAVAGLQKATVAWVPPSNGGSPITSYVVTASPGGAVTNAPASATSVVVTGLTAGTAYTFTVAAVNSVGTGPASLPSNAVTPTAPPAYAPFASWAAFVARQYADLVNRAPTAAESSSWVTQLTARTKTPGDLADSLRRSSENTTNVDPVARLYRAFLGRAPDASGLKFWIKRRRTGTWTLTKIADSFATSNEFKTKYGSLTNRQFVTRIYTDVLGRTADTAGVNYWTGKLDRKEKTRGGVMVGFSESSEYKRKQAENTDVAVAYIFLLGRAATTAETTDWTTREKAGTTDAALLTELLSSPAYATHITG